MFERSLAGRGRSWILAGILASLLPALATPALAHRHHHYWHVAHHSRHSEHRHLAAHRHHGGHFAEHGAPSRLAEIAVDTNSGRVLYAQNENDLRHPASITKVMTLYLLFKELDKGRLHLSSRLTISPHAAAQAPTKLGLRPGQTISVDDAIKAVVTKSANDIAVAIAEGIGGSEENFCAMMTREAHALGMMHTHYADASGLPNDTQITTAADLAILGRAIQERFPRYFHYFSLQEFAYRGQRIRNHNHLLGRIPGLDGIKTGYTRASGFNLLTSVHYRGRAIVAVVLGGTSAASRDRAMAALIGREIDEASTRRSAPMIAEVSEERASAHEDEAPVREARVHEARVHDARVQEAWAARAEALGTAPQDGHDVPLPAERPRPAYIASTPVSTDSDMTTGSVNHAALDGSTERPEASTTTPSTLHWVVGPAPVKSARSSPGISDSAPAAAGISVKPPSQADAPVADAAPIVRPGWIIQIGASDDEAKAGALLARAKARKLSALDAAQAFTEKVQKGDATLYRARFAGLDADDAEAACRSLKRSGFGCFAMKN
ncbi:MAG: D-alanyl-D-alanine carboxypeptidase [Methylovirgula sp.]|nr:D-alanyl-D-alanine carboxypeptidase [Methylovirgula sp.]